MTSATSPRTTDRLPDGPGDRTRRVLLAVVATLAVVALLLTGAVAGAVGAREETPGDTSAEAGFARDMSVHHGQAVDMAMAILPRTGDPQLRSLAADIALTQQAQIGRMQGWLAEWGLSPTGTQPAMSWMADAGGEHTHGLLPDGRMPGMATAGQVAALRTLPVDEAEVSFLQLMTAHHLAGVDMAEAGLAVLTEPDPRAIAQSIVTSQTGEVQTLRAMLAQRQAGTGAAPGGDDMAGMTHDHSG